MKYKLLNIIKQNHSILNKNLPPVGSGKLSYDYDNIYLDIVGVPSSILIQYTGAVYFESNMSPLIKVRFNKNAIYIFNFFKQDFVENIFSYSGDLKITNCQIMSFNQSSFYPEIESKIGDDTADNSETNFEDDDMLLFGEEKQARGKMYRGASKTTFPSSRMDEYGTIQKFGKAEKQLIATTAIRSATKIAQNRALASKTSISKPSVSKPTTSKPGVSKPGVSKPAVSKPTVSKPTVSKPTISSPKIEETRGKY